MKKPILIIETDKKLIEELFSNDPQDKLAGFDIYVAKTLEGAEHILQQYSDIQTILFNDDYIQDKLRDKFNNKTVFHINNTDDIFSALTNEKLVKNENESNRITDSNIQLQITNLHYRIQKIEYLFKDIKELLENFKSEYKSELDNIKADIQSCPVKKGLIEKALASKNDSNCKSDKPEGLSKTIIAGFFTLIGIIITTGVTFLSEILKFFSQFIK